MLDFKDPRSSILEKEIVSMLRYESKTSFISVDIIDSSNKLPLAQSNSMELLLNGLPYQDNISPLFKSH